MEEWRDIPGYEGLYQASSHGRVRSVPHLKYGSNYKRPSGYYYMTKSRIIAPKKKYNGYLQVNLYKDGKPKTYSVHRLVLTTFIGHSDLTINHINEDKTDNRLENLEYLTASENIRYSRARPVESFDLATGKTIKRYEAGADVREDGFDVGAVNNCCRLAKGYISHKGLGWRYSNVEAA